MRNEFVTFSAAPLTYADETVERGDRQRRRLARRRRSRKIVLSIVLSGLIAGGLFARYAYIQSYCELVGVDLRAGDSLVDVESSIGWNDYERYFKLKLSAGTYQSLFAKVTGRLPGRDTIFPAKWPWRVPEDAVVREGFGESYMFSPSNRTVYIYRWTM